MAHSSTNMHPSLIVHCPTQEDYDQLMQVCEELGYEWSRYSSHAPKWDDSKEDTYVAIMDNGSMFVLRRTSLPYHEDKPVYTLPEALKILKPMTKCNGVHCKCMNLGGNCHNHHYATCPEHNPVAGMPEPHDTTVTKPVKECENGGHPENNIKDCTICGAPNCCLTCCVEAHSKKQPPMRSTEITKDNLRVGDVIVNDDGESAMVLEVGQTSFLRSDRNDHNHAFDWLTFSEARDGGWSIVLPPEEQAPRKVTMDEVKKVMGNVEIIEE